MSTRNSFCVALVENVWLENRRNRKGLNEKVLKGVGMRLSRTHSLASGWLLFAQTFECLSGWTGSVLKQVAAQRVSEMLDMLG